MKLYAIKTNKCTYLRQENSWSSSEMAKYRYDGQLPKETFSKDWWEVKSVPKKIERKISQPNINHRFMLKEVPGLSRETHGNLCPVIDRDKCQYKEGYEWLWKEEYAHLSSLYEYKSDPQPCKWEAVDFEIVLWDDIKDLDNYKPISFPIGKVWNSCTGKHQEEDITEDCISYNIVDSILYPKEKLANKTSTLSSQQMFNIVVNHVKKYLDGTVATITSDYGFHFAVSKTVRPASHLLEEQKWTVKYNSRDVRKLAVIDICHAKDTKYGKTVMPAFTGKNHKDLKKKVDTFLKHLMNVINEPLSDCPHCQGRGIVNFEEFKIKKEVS